jgi:hypothetical protein
MRPTASTPSVAQLFGALALVALGTALVMATDLLLPNVTQSGMQENAVRLAVPGRRPVRRLARADPRPVQRPGAPEAIAAPLLVWQSVVWWLALAGAFQGRIGPAPLLSLDIVLCC